MRKSPFFKRELRQRAGVDSVGALRRDSEQPGRVVYLFTYVSLQNTLRGMYHGKLPAATLAHRLGHGILQCFSHRNTAAARSTAGVDSARCRASKRKKSAAPAADLDANTHEPVAPGALELGVGFAALAATNIKKKTWAFPFWQRVLEMDLVRSRSRPIFCSQALPISARYPSVSGSGGT